MDLDVGPGTLTSISAWRYWLWDPQNDRDFLGLPITTISANPSKQYQWQQELRYAGSVNEDLSFVAGAFWFNHDEKNGHYIATRRQSATLTVTFSAAPRMRCKAISAASTSRPGSDPSEAASRQALSAGARGRS